MGTYPSLLAQRSLLPSSARARPRPFHPLLPDTGRVRAVEHQLWARPPLRLSLKRTADGRQVERQRPQLVDLARHWLCRRRVRGDTSDAALVP